MTKYRSEVGYKNGVKYLLEFDQLGNQQACDPEYQDSWFWFLYVKGESQGPFKTKREAMTYIAN